MDKYEYKLKLEQLQNLVAAGDYTTAAEMADTINWQKVRSVNTLCMVGEIYEKTGKYEACRAVLLQAYDHSPIGRNIVSKLAEVAIKAKKIDEAQEYYNEFLEIAPKDNMRYVLAYEISCLKEEPLPVRIAILEDLKEHEYTEKWAYELAVLYGQAEMRDKCVETCDELILWFGDGEYVEKALDLKRLYQPLTASQEEKYKQFREKKGMVEINIPQTTEPKNVIHEMVKSAENTVTASKFNTSNLEEELAKSMKQIMNATEKETVADTMESIKKIVSDIPYLNGEHEEDVEPAFDQEKINAQVDKSLKKDFKELLSETEQAKKEEQPKKEIPVVVKASEKKTAEEETAEQVASAQASIEEILADWKKTKRAAEAAIAAAEQKKLEMAKENALIEAGQIMERLKTLIPILDATPGEDIPTPEETTVAAALASDETFAEDDSEEAEETAEAGFESDDTQDDAETAESAETQTMTEKKAEAAAESEESQKAEEAEPETMEEVSEATEKAIETSEEESVSNDEEESAENASSEEKTASEDKADEAQDQKEESASETVVEETEAADISATREMPDVQSFRAQNTAAEETQKAADEDVEDLVAEDTEKENTDITEETSEVETEEVSEESGETEVEEEDHLHVVEPVPDEELEKTLAQATQMFMENSNVEVPVGKAAVSQNTGVLPEIKMPEDIEAEQQEYQLTEEQKELFSYFLPVPGMEDQIRQILLGAKSRIGNSVTSLAGNILVQGEEGSGKTVFATSLIKAIQQEVGNEDAKIGKISAESLNKKDFAALIPKIAGGYLIVDKAGELTRETAIRMSQLMEQNTQGMVVVLEDTRAGIRKAMQLDFGFAKKFTEKVDIPIFTIDELVQFGKSYAKEMECTIDQMGVLALYNRINNIQKLERATTLAEVKDIVDEAIESAEGGGIKRAFGSIFSKKYNENDYLILHEKDFEN